MLNVCPICLNEILGEICGFHTTNTVEKNWHISNRIWNNMIMRGITPRRIEIGCEKENEL